jgi:ribosomal-protein-alanine N-acetyltransferase
MFPEITTNRFKLRQFRDGDLENIFRGLSHPEVIRYYGVSYATLESAKSQLTFFNDLELKETGKWWAITSHDDKIFYGAAGLNNRIKEHRKAEIGFWLLQEHWGKGIIKEVVPIICDYGFKQMDLHRIEAIVESENQNSKTVLGILKFTHEGTMRECEIKNGKFISLDIYAMLNKG